VAKMGDHTLIGASGEMSDFQSIMSMMDTMHQVSSVQLLLEIYIYIYIYIPYVSIISGH
jgi:20S proteasome alpha/beta subunit